MSSEIEQLVSYFERGAITRRQLIAGLSALCLASVARGATGASLPAQQAQAQGPIPISGLDHVALRVSDVARSVAFYREHLGGRVTSQSSNSAFLAVGEHWIALFGPRAVSTGFPPTERGVDHVAFHSPQHRSRDERMGVLRAHGLDPSSPPGSNRVYFRDPDGIILQLS